MLTRTGDSGSTLVAPPCSPKGFWRKRTSTRLMSSCVTELVARTAAGGQYALRSAAGYELEAVLPSALVDFIDQTQSPAGR